MTSGTGSVTTMWLEATACARRKPGTPTVAPFTASTAEPARTAPAGVVGTTSAVRRRTGVRSKRRAPPRARPPAGRARAVRDGRRRMPAGTAPPRKPASLRAGHAGRRGTHLVRHAERGAGLDRVVDGPSCASLVATRASAPAGTTRRRPRARTTLRSRARRARRLARRRALATVPPVAQDRQVVQSVETSRRSARSARAHRGLPRARPRRSPARVPSAAMPSRGRGTRRRRPRTSAVVSPSSGPGRLDRPGVLEPPAVARVPHPFHDVARVEPRPRHSPRRRCAARQAAILRLQRGGGSSAGRAPGCGPGGRGFESRPPPLRHATLERSGPVAQRSRAAGFEPACGGSTPPGDLAWGSAPWFPPTGPLLLVCSVTAAWPPWANKSPSGRDGLHPTVDNIGQLGSVGRRDQGRGGGDRRRDRVQPWRVRQPVLAGARKPVAAEATTSATATRPRTPRGEAAVPGRPLAHAPQPACQGQLAGSSREMSVRTGS